MELGSILKIILLLFIESEAFFRSKKQLDSFLPATIQVLNHYKDQLEKYSPYYLSSFCLLGRKNGMIDDNFGKASGMITKDGAKIIQYNGYILIPEKADVCARWTHFKINQFLMDLIGEAERRNVDEFQGFSKQVLSELEKTSRMSSAEQIQFILNELLREKEVISTGIKCKLIRFVDELNRPNSKLHRNLLLVKPLNYIGWK